MSFLLSRNLETVPFNRECEVQIITLREDDGKKHPSCFCVSIFKFINKVINTISLAVDEKTVAELAMRDLPEVACVETFSRNNFYIRNPVVMKKMLSYHRNDLTADGIYSHSSIATAMLSISNQIFPKNKDVRSLNDSIMTCEPKFTKKYRDFLLHFFSKESLKSYFTDIENIIDQTLQLFEKEKSEIILNDKIKLLSTTIMSSLFLGSTQSFEEITSATSNIIPWIGDNLASTVKLYRAFTFVFPRYKLVSDDDKNKTKKVLSKTIDEAIINAKQDNSPDSIVKAMLKESFTIEEIESMITTLYVAGQDNVSTSLTHSLLKLAQDPDLQQKIIDENLPPLESKYIRALICESLRVRCPIGGIGRIASKNLQLTVRSKVDGTLISECRIKKGDLIDPMPMFAAKDPGSFKNPEEFDYERFMKTSSFLPSLEFLPFGGAVHRCPGWYLYYAIAAIMVSNIVKNYHITTSFEGEPKIQKGFLISIADQIPIKFFREEKEFKELYHHEFLPSSVEGWV